jgi:hypothetical protein
VVSESFTHRERNGTVSYSHTFAHVPVKTSGDGAAPARAIWTNISVWGRDGKGPPKSWNPVMALEGNVLSGMHLCGGRTVSLQLR